VDFRAQAASQMGQLWQRRAELTSGAALKIGSYLALSGECPTQALHQQAWEHQQQIFIPLISAPGQWAELKPQSELKKTPLGIFEPLHTSSLPTQALDIILLPLLSIDHQGYRLGYGGGFYDQLLAAADNRPYLIGLGFHNQLTEKLPHDPWDIPLDAFLSEQGWLFFSHSQGTI